MCRSPARVRWGTILPPESGENHPLCMIQPEFLKLHPPACPYQTGYMGQKVAKCQVLEIIIKTFHKSA
ncbi:MAG: hypothetical protein HN580_19490 [Deltaproteobacteria bacterium]|nr:hypothetical protein [Deltaproteobacteria bacterium]MBT4265341.1 hypothetical protein [Deltaproteobacteria bacterium]MBT4638795.1 hypothetical protein [Deltaproteobacteria bacterium]MBT6502195.1 hypothetical protein [Deltaproteobacteria bacterium]MBT6616037.1 hypothetical protein [Deltaproteobacteria bacterium]